MCVKASLYLRREVRNRSAVLPIAPGMRAHSSNATCAASLPRACGRRALIAYLGESRLAMMWMRRRIAKRHAPVHSGATERGFRLVQDRQWMRMGARTTCLSRRRRSVAQDRFAAARGGARASEKRSEEVGQKAGATVGTGSASNRTDNPREDSTGSCPCARNWQTGQKSDELLNACAESWEECRNAPEPASEPWPEPGSACKHGPHSMIAAWNATTVATRIRRRIRGITLDLDPIIDGGGEHWSSYQSRVDLRAVSGRPSSLARTIAPRTGECSLNNRHAIVNGVLKKQARFEPHSGYRGRKPWTVKRTNHLKHYYI